MRRWLLALVLLGSVLAPAARAATGEVPPAAPLVHTTGERPVLEATDWLSLLNFYRETAKQPHLSNNRAWTAGELAHSRYMAGNGVIGHSEDRAKPYFTPAGDLAARNSNVYLRWGPSTVDDGYFVSGWMASPFHALGMIDPRLHQTAYGRVDLAGRVGASLDVLRGVQGWQLPTSPVVWPADGMQVPITSYSGTEWPDPLSFCPGYRRTAGLPVLVMLPEGVRATGSTITKGGAAVPHCRFDGASRGDEYAAATMRSRNAVVLMPRGALTEYTPYTVTLATTRGTLRWTFSAGEVLAPRNVALTGLAGKPFQTSTSFPLSWSATDAESGVASFDVRYRSAPAGGGFGPLAAWQSATTARSATFTGDPGATYCFSARAMDKAGNRSRWTRESCTSLPLGNLDLTASSLLWLPLADPGYYTGTASTTLLQGSTLSTAVVGARRVAVVVSPCSTCGQLDVTLNGARIGGVDLARLPAGHRVLVVLPLARPTSGQLVVTASSSLLQVVVEGLGASPV